ncbi:MAG: LamG domain-containing protein, partial [Candidatus Nanoarchaeia archaeon]
AHAETEGTASNNEMMQPPNNVIESINDGIDETPLLDIINSTMPFSEDVFTNFTNNESAQQVINPTSSTTSTHPNPVHFIQSLIESLTMTGNTAAPTSSTTSTHPNPVHFIQSLIESLTMTGNTAAPTSSTTPTSPNIPVVIPNAAKSWGSNATVTDSLIGNVYINQTGIVLDGGFIKAAGNYTNQTSNITIAAWIKPEYASGASIFTILSKDKSFELTLNNIVKPSHVATFSVFDGIKWHNVQTATEISQNWSHIAATFNGTDITIYVNGTASKTAKTTSTVIVDGKGNIQNITPQMPSKYSDVVVGATLDTRTVETAQKSFTGSLDEVRIYDEYLTADQVLALYNKTLPLILLKSVPETSLEIELSQINLLNQTNINGTLNTNATQYIVIPGINHTNQITISTWVDPDYNNFSDEFTVISKDRSFVLSINNIINPKHTATFAVFDGIRWTEIEGTSKIENLSHLAAIINSTSISLYVNGTLEARKTLLDTFEVSKDKLVPTTIINSITDVVIGAYLSTLRKEPQLSNIFSGTINDAVIYNRALTEIEIKQLFTSQIPQTQHNPLSTENILTFTDNITVTLIPRTTDNPAYFHTEDILGIADSVEYTINNTTNKTQYIDNLGIADTINLFQDNSIAINETTTLNLGILDNIDLQKSSTLSKDPNIIFEERGRDYYKVEFVNGTGKATFGLPEWIFDPAINEYKEHIIKETDDEIIYNSMQIPFIFNKNDCSLRIYEKGQISSDLPAAIGKKYWKLMETQVGSAQWIESTLNNKSCKVQTFENSTGFFINALRESGDGRFLVTYGKKTDQPLESFLYFTNTNANKTNTKFGFIQ